METSWAIRSDQGWHLTLRGFINLDFKKSKFSRCPRICQKCWPSSTSVVGFRTWGGYSWNLRWKSWGQDLRILRLDAVWFFIYGFPRGLALLLEDLLIFQLCPLEESASHHTAEHQKSTRNNMTRARDPKQVFGNIWQQPWLENLSRAD